MEFIGNLLKKIDQREGDSQRGHWRVASYLLETVEMYPKRMAVDVSDGEYAQRIEQFDALIGKNVKVKFDIDAREWQGKWYNSIKAFGIRENVPQMDTRPAGNATGTVAANGTQNNGGAEMTGQPDGNAAGTEAANDSPFPPQEGSINWEMMGK